MSIDLKSIGVTLLPFFLLACTAGVQVKENEEGRQVKSVDGLWLTCSNVYDFTRDCNIFTGAERSVEVEGYEVTIAGSDNGHQILVMDKGTSSHFFSVLLIGSISPYSLYDKTLVSFPENQKAENGFEAIVKELNKSDVGILDVITVTAGDAVMGYILSLDNNGYSVLTRE